MKLFTMVGLPGSGKSTFSKSRQNCVVVDLDGIRKELYGDEAIQGDGRMIISIAFNRIMVALTEGKDVIFDGTNVTVNRRKQLIKRFSTADHVAVFVNTPVEECKRRNASRSRHVPERVIDRYARQLVAPKLEEGFQEIIIIK